MAGRSYTSITDPRYKFKAKERDNDITGLDYFGARYYDSRIGRWLAVDPLAEKYPGWSPYNYVPDNPMGLVDPDGHGWKEAQRTVQCVGSALKNAAIGILRSPVILTKLVASYGVDPAGTTLQVGLGLESVYDNRIAAISSGDDFRRAEAITETAIDVAGLIGAVASVYQSVRFARLAKAGSAFDAAEAATIDASKSLGKALISIDDMLANPNLLSGKTLPQVENILSTAKGWKAETSGKGAHKGQGWVLREYNEAGNPKGRMVRWHPGGGHHGPDPYWRVNDFRTKSNIIR